MVRTSYNPFMTTKFSKLQRLPAYKVLANAIAKEILEGRIRHGEQLPTETTLCEEFGASRSTVREGIRLLEETGLIRRESSKRMVASRPSTGEVSTHVQRAMVLHQVSFRNLWEAAMILEPAMSEQAARHITEADLEALRDNLARTEVALKAGRSLVELDLEFHVLIADAVHNPALKMSREPLANLFYSAFESVLNSVPRAGQRLLTAHRQLYKLLAERDAAGAREWMHKHISDFKRGWEAAGLNLDAAVDSVSRPPSASFERPAPTRSAAVATGAA